MSDIIDVHSHPLLPDYVAAIQGHTGDMPLPPWSIEQHLQVMDDHGIRGSVLSLPNADELREGDAGARLLHELNEQLSDLVSAHPDRLGAFGSLPMDDVDRALDEVVHVLDDLGLDGVALSAQHGGVHLGEPAFEPLLDELDRRGAVVFVHPGTPAGYDAAQPLHVSALEFMFETTRMVATMVLSGSLARHPRLQVIATHAGGTVPYLANRLALISQMPWAYRGGPALSPAEVMAGIAGFHYDLTASASPMQLQALTRVVGTDRLLMGFDQPMMPSGTIGAAIDGIDGFLTDAQVCEAVHHGNAERLFPRFAR